MKTLMQVLVYCLVMALNSGCATLYDRSPHQQIAHISEQAEGYLELVSMPLPKGKIPVSVYYFRDQTGQYKAAANGSSFSTAVTQGATSILVQALGDSQWFIPVEREGLQNILTERKIIRAAQQANENQNDHELPPLMTSSIVLEGGIIGYDTNLITVGAGIGYYGFNVSELHRQDQVTVYLRAVDVRSGQILASVSSSKRVLSQEVRSGLFRYLSLNRLAEAEAGYSTNEPIYLCVLQAIQKVVVSLIVEGVDKGLWALKDPATKQHKIFKNYRTEKRGILTRLVAMEG